MAFEPSHAGSVLTEQSLRISEGFQNMYVRAEALKQSHERFEQEKQKFAGELALQRLDIRQQENNIKQQANQLEVQSLQLDGARIDLDSKKRQEQAAIAENTAFEDALAKFPAVAKGYSAIANNDVRGLAAAVGQLQASFGPYANNEKYAARVAQVVAPVKQALLDRLVAAQGILEMDANEHLFNLNTALATNDTDALARILKDPEVRKAALSSGEQGKALRDMVQKATTELISRQTKLDEKTAEFEGKKAEKDREAKTTRSVPGFSGVGRSAEQAGKFAESYASYKSSSAALDELINITSDSGALEKLAPTDLSARANTLATIVTAENRTKIVGPGAVSESEWDILRSIVANPTKLKNIAFRSQATASLQTLRRVLEMKMQNEAEVNGYTPESGNPLFKGPKAQVPKVGEPFSATINGQQVSGTWHEQNGRQGLLTESGLFYPANP